MTFFAGVVSFLFYPCRTYGRSNVPRHGGFVLASNHESNIDPILLPVCCPRQLRFLAKDSLFKNPILGAIIRCGGGIPVRRGTADRKALGEAVGQLQVGYGLIIFPQGTRGGAKIQAGAGFLAISAGVPVVPVYIDGTDQVLPKGGALPRRSKVKVVFGKPVKFSSDESYDVITEKVMGLIWALKEESSALKG